MDYEMILLGMFSVVGMLQWVKNIIALPDNLKWIWAIANPVISVGVALLFGIMPEWGKVALVITAGSQLGYENIVQVVKERLLKK